MKPVRSYEQYPWGIIALSNTVTLITYAAGIFIMFRWHWIAGTAFAIYLAFLEFRLIKKHCVNCYYYGRYCAFGRGRISSWFFRKGEPDQFCHMHLTWKSLIPDLLTVLIPVITGIMLMILHFDLCILIAVIALIFLATYGNNLIRGTFSCRYCRQKELGCPAQELFSKKQKNP